MGKKGPEKFEKKTPALSGEDLFPDGMPSQAYQDGLRLILKFKLIKQPTLDRIEFKASKLSSLEYLQKDSDDASRSFRNTDVAKTIAIFFLDYVCARLQSPPIGYHMEGGKGDPVASLGNALTDTDGTWYRLFVELLPEGGKANRVTTLFKGSNWHGKLPSLRVVEVDSEYLPADCIEIYWENKRLSGLPAIQKLTEEFRRAWELPPPAKLELPNDESKASRTETDPKTATPEVESKSQPAKDTGTENPKASSDATFGAFPIEYKSLPNRKKAPESETPTEPQGLSSLPPPPPVPPSLFQITNPHGHTWDDFEPLLNFGSPDNDADVWRIRDACEGVVVFGAVGSGKTSGSGAAIARAYLHAGFGGLVLTAKPDEAKRWLRLCEETGRGGDCVHVTPLSGHKLNILQYESQRPGSRMAVTDDLITLFRCILDSISRNQGTRNANEEFWTNSTNQLMRQLFDLFLLAGEPLAMDRFVRFMNLAPQDSEQDWTQIKPFADLIDRARANADKGSEADKRIFAEAFDYWTKDLPRITAATRSGIVTGFSAMANSLGGRGIYEMVNTETNLTPEMILSGKVVIMDVPLKGNVQGGRMVQTIWKLLFQQAVERRSDKGEPTARPAFLWEDEGHLFFFQNDVEFQPTARDIRAPHVIMSQNIHNFLQEGHNQHAMQSVFSAMNTYILHCNGDLETNCWASDRIGEEKKLKLTTDGLLKPLRHQDISFFERSQQEVRSVGQFGLSEKTKSSLRPEDFSKLKRGGDGTCEAVVLWLSHQFAVNKGRNFCVLTFEQEPRPI